MARAILVGDCRPLIAADVFSAEHGALSVQTAEEAWNLVLPSSPNSETDDVDVAILGVNLSDAERSELMHWMEEETSILPMLVLATVEAPHPNAYGYYTVNDSKDDALKIVRTLLDGVDKSS